MSQAPPSIYTWADVEEMADRAKGCDWVTLDDSATIDRLMRAAMGDAAYKARAESRRIAAEITTLLARGVSA